MNRIGLFSVGILIFGTGFEAFAAPAEKGALASCSVETLRGSYTYSIQGYRDGEPYASSGLWSFDGEGRAAIIYTNSRERTQLSASGTYTVNTDCSGSMTLDGTTVNNFYLSPSGESFTFVRVSGDGVIGTVSTRVSRKLTVTRP